MDRGAWQARVRGVVKESDRPQRRAAVRGVLPGPGLATLPPQPPLRPWAPGLPATRLSSASRELQAPELVQQNGVCRLALPAKRGR